MVFRAIVVHWLPRTPRGGERWGSTPPTERKGGGAQDLARNMVPRDFVPRILLGAATTAREVVVPASTLGSAPCAFSTHGADSPPARVSGGLSPLFLLCFKERFSFINRTPKVCGCGAS